MSEEPPPIPAASEPSPIPQTTSSKIRNLLDAGSAWAVLGIYISLTLSVYFAFAMLAIVAQNDPAIDFSDFWEGMIPMITVAAMGLSGLAAWLLTLILSANSLRWGQPGGIGLAATSWQRAYLAGLGGFALGALYVTAAAWAMPGSENARSGIAVSMALDGGFPRFGWMLLFVFVAPLVEEFVFRGVIYTGLAHSWGMATGALVSTGLFLLTAIVLLGVNVLALSMTACLGLALVSVRIHSGSLLPPLAMHTAFGLALALFVLSLSTIESGGNPFAKLRYEKKPEPVETVSPQGPPEATNPQAPEPPSLREVTSNVQKRSGALKAEARKLLKAQDFDALDSFITQLYTSKEQRPNGAWYVDDVIKALSQTPSKTTSISDWERHIAGLETWRQASSQTTTSSSVLARAWMQYARAVYPKKNQPASYRANQAYEERLDQAVTILDKARTIETQLPDWYMANFDLAARQHWDIDRDKELYDDAADDFPGHTPLDREMMSLMRLNHQWKPKALMAFATRAAKSREAIEGDLLYAQLESEATRFSKKSSFWQKEASDWPRAKRGFQEMLKQHPDSLNAHSLVARNAWLAGDAPFTQEMLLWLDGRVDAKVWDKADFRTAWQWAFENQPPPSAEEETTPEEPSPPEAPSENLLEKPETSETSDPEMNDAS